MSRHLRCFEGFIASPTDWPQTFGLIGDTQEAAEAAFRNCYLSDVDCESFQQRICNPSQTACTDFYKSFLTKWQSYLPDEIKDKPLSSLVLPGTHNSCSYRILRGARPMFMNNVLYGLLKAPLVWKTVRNWTQTQTQDLIGQFESGIRLFDLRLAKDSANNFYISHTFYVERLTDCLEQIRFCLNTYQTELIVLNVKVDHAYRFNLTSDDINKIFAIIVETFDAHAIPARIGIDSLTMNHVEKMPEKLIIYSNLNREKCGSLEPTVLGKVRFGKSCELWPNRTSFADSFETCRLKLQSMPPEYSEFSYLAFIETHNARSILKGLFSFNSIVKSSRNSEVQLYLSELLDIAKANRRRAKMLCGITLDCPSREAVRTILKFNFDVDSHQV
jgi:hypothetical protein